VPEFEIPKVGMADKERIYYLADERDKLVQRDKKLIEELGIQDSYLEFVEKDTEMLFQLQTEDGVRVKAGLIGAYTVSEMAMWLNEQVHAYVQMGTMGREYPIDSIETNRRLHANMISGYDKNRIVVSFEKFNEEDDSWSPISGVQAYFGKEDIELAKAFNQSEVSIGTLSALRINPENDSMPYEHFVKRWGEVKMSEVVGMSRLWRRSVDVLNEMNVKNTEMAWENMAYLTVAIMKMYVNREIDTLPKVFIYDTLSPIHRKLEKMFYMEKIVEANNLTSSDEVKGDVLKYHYGSPEIGGYEGQIIMGAATLGEYFIGSWEYLRSRNVDVLELLNNSRA